MTSSMSARSSSRLRAMARSSSLCARQLGSLLPNVGLALRAIEARQVGKDVRALAHDGLSPHFAQPERFFSAAARLRALSRRASLARSASAFSRSAVSAIS